MRYLLEGIRLPLNVDEAKIKQTVREHLGIGLRSFRYETIFKKVVYEPLTKKAHLEFAFAVETSAYIKDTSINFVTELEQEHYAKLALPNGVAVVGDDLKALLIAYLISKEGYHVTLFTSDSVLARKQRQQGAYIHFSSCKGKEAIEDLLISFLGEKVGLKGDLVPLSPVEFSSFVDRIIGEFTKNGGDLVHGATLVGSKLFLGRLKKVFYKVGEEQKEAKFDRIVMVDQGKSGSFYNSIKAKKTKSRYLLRLYIESRQKDAESVIYNDYSHLPAFYESKVVSAKSGNNIRIRYPFACASLANLSNIPVSPEPNLVMIPDRRRLINIMVLDADVTSGEDNYRSALSCCKRINLPGSIPCQKVSDFLLRKESFRLGNVKTTYSAGVYLDNFHSLLPVEVSDAVQSALLKVRSECPYLSSDAILTGVEGKVIPGEVYIPEKVSNIVKAYWNRSCEDLDLVHIVAFAFTSLDDFFGKVR
ncbi:MAG: hypothetical protein K6B65_05680 [Bacilli bacterium]|nr:hypothetical protein [Bacilli bacterium]